jgi:GNAT superfamily N-acetyltransferase
LIYTSSEGTKFTVAYDQRGYSEGETAHHWSAVTPDGEVIAELWAELHDSERPDLGEHGVSFRAGQISQVETLPAYRREGIARQLYNTARDQFRELHHSPPEHRTDEGNLWAEAVD